LENPINTGFFKVEGKSKMDNAENPLFMGVFEFREAHKILQQGGYMQVKLILNPG
jgi:hypothetical protein